MYQGPPYGVEEFPSDSSPFYPFSSQGRLPGPQRPMPTQPNSIKRKKEVRKIIGKISIPCLHKKREVSSYFWLNMHEIVREIASKQFSKPTDADRIEWQMTLNWTWLSYNRFTGNIIWWSGANEILMKWGVKNISQIFILSRQTPRWLKSKCNSKFDARKSCTIDNLLMWTGKVANYNWIYLAFFGIEYHTRIIHLSPPHCMITLLILILVHPLENNFFLFFQNTSISVNCDLTLTWLGHSFVFP